LCFVSANQGFSVVSLLPSEFSSNGNHACNELNEEKIQVLKDLLIITKNTYNVQNFRGAVNTITGRVDTATPTLSPTGYPTPLTLSPTLSPTMEPSRLPTRAPAPRVCITRDRAFCNGKGYCSTAGDGCVCDDYLHYWPSERCATWHNGRELHSGAYCYPDTVDNYCSWMGTCSFDGMSCQCFDAAHRKSSERCLHWYSNIEGLSTQAPTPAPDDHTLACQPGDRGYCHNRGKCVSPDEGCECDDVLHYWASERCATYHWGPELDDGHCCTPGETNYYCSWMGVCDEDGSTCSCFDQEHRSPLDRCQKWYSDLLIANIRPVMEGFCPDLMSVPDDSSDKKTSSSDANSPTWGMSSKEWWIAIGVVSGCVFACMILLVHAATRDKNEPFGPVSSIPQDPGGNGERTSRGSRFSFISPMFGTHNLMPPKSQTGQHSQSTTQKSQSLPVPTLQKSLTMISMGSKDYGHLEDEEEI
jgi:hypothetical protein